MPNLLTFDEAIEKSHDKKNRKVLLGNGFSRACKEDIFSYDALYKKAEFNKLSASAHEAFESLGTTDFEIVIKALRQAALLAEVYVRDRPELVATLNKDAAGLRELLVGTIAQNHPERPQDIAPERYKACRKFLDNFKCIYTLNYDLLLYWALMQDELPPMQFFELEDGFRKPEGQNADYVRWDSGTSHRQTVHYMHGALHIFDAGSELQKYTWCNTQIALIDQIKAALDGGQFPLFVAEDTYKAKMERIMHSAYLGKSKSSFEKIKHDLFVFGFAFGQADEHVLHLIGANQVMQLFVSLFGDPQSPDNKKVVERVESIKARRGKYKLETYYFDAASAHVWG